MAARADGATITDSSGREFVDCIAGYGTHNLGHNPPDIVAALLDQLGSNPQTTRPLVFAGQVDFARRLERVTPGRLSCSFALNSGSEAVDFGLKLARLSTRRPGIISARGSFHGHTFGALSASGMPAFQRPFGPLLPDFKQVRFGDLDELAAAIQGDTAAVLLEPIQHEAGVHIPPPSYLREVRRLCDDAGALLILDEVKTGLGKTGRMFACEHSDVEPDVLILGKSLGGGLIPMGAVVATPEAWRMVGLSFPMSASSYAGNALAACVGTATISALTGEVLAGCRRKGAHLLAAAQQCAQDFPTVVARSDGLGLLIGLECTSSRIAREFVLRMIRENFLLFTAFGNGAVVMVEPPLVISDEHVECLSRTMLDVCAELAVCAV